MANFKDVIINALSENKEERFFGVNRGLMEAAVSTKKKPGFIKVAMSDEAVRDFMGRKYVGFIICFDGDELNKIANELDGLAQDIESA